MRCRPPYDLGLLGDVDPLRERGELEAGFATPLAHPCLHKLTAESVVSDLLGRELFGVKQGGHRVGWPIPRGIGASGLHRVADSIPGVILGDLRAHFDRFTAPDADAWVFTGEKGAALRRSNFQRLWTRATTRAGVFGLHVHDLRHTGNTLAAMTGPSLRELMARMGHSSPRAALIYQHATAERDRAIADGLSKLVRGDDQADDDDPPGVPAVAG